MADFQQWNHESLVQFAKDATVRLSEYRCEIEGLQAEVRTLHLAWKNALRESAANATVPACETENPSLTSSSLPAR